MLTVFFFVMSKCVQIDGTLDKADHKEISICVLGIDIGEKNVCIWVGQLMGKDQENSQKNN